MMYSVFDVKQCERHGIGTVVGRLPKDYFRQRLKPLTSLPSTTNKKAYASVTR